ncbi:MAG: CoA pyrophosphatase [Ideonella sp. WA131b]|jgi:8-oxo-dGTP pyrophosphatase MutT (NUDIX family)|nr:CoA pyrophosphatase [Ideonella sp. WA131b]
MPEATPQPPLWAGSALRAHLARFHPQPLHDPLLRRAAVALVCTEAGHGADLPGLPVHTTWQPDPALLLTRRADHLRAHAGQWALPGGRIDEGEAPEAAARRELLEELGLALPPEAVLGRLDDYATRSGYVITPVVLWGGPARALVPNPAEVAAVHRVPVAELLRADAPLLDAVPGAEHPVLRLPLGRSWVAAPTAAFLYQFREWVLLGRATRVAHFDQPRFAWR